MALVGYESSDEDEEVQTPPTKVRALSESAIASFIPRTAGSTDSNETSHLRMKSQLR
jgi:hypothetical protein